MIFSFMYMLVNRISLPGIIKYLFTMMLVWLRI